jgi:SdrD B-like domain
VSKFQRPVIRILILLTSVCPILEACSCVTLASRCDTAWNSDGLVFLGRVVSKLGGEEPVENGIVKLTDYEVHFALMEIFHGESKSIKEVVLYTGSGGGDCGYPFVVGTSYLVYAYNSGGRLTASTCSETAPEVMVGGALRELRAIRAGGRADDLFGTIGIGPKGSGWADLVETQPLANVPVHVIGSHGVRFSTTTDEHGTYAFPSLPPGKYRIGEDFPAGLTLAHHSRKDQLTADVKHTKEVSAGCRLDAFPRPDGEISGMVVDQKGKGLPGFLTIEPADPKEAEAAMRRGGLRGEDTDEGVFSLGLLPQGRYRLVFRPKIGGRTNFGLKFSWPAYSGNSNSEGIELGLGQHIQNVRVEVSLPAIRQ